MLISRYPLRSDLLLIGADGTSNMRRCPSLERQLRNASRKASMRCAHMRAGSLCGIITQNLNPPSSRKVLLPGEPKLICVSSGSTGNVNSAKALISLGTGDSGSASNPRISQCVQFACISVSISLRTVKDAIGSLEHDQDRRIASIFIELTLRFHTADLSRDLCAATGRPALES